MCMSHHAALSAISGGFSRCLLPASDLDMCDTVAPDAVLTRYARTIIRFKAWQLAHRSGFCRNEQEDLEQDLWTALFAQAANFDANRASIDTFINRVVNTTVAILLRERRRQKRLEGTRAHSLDESLRKGEQFSAATLRELDDRRRDTVGFCFEESLSETEEALVHALNSMPPKLQDICLRVMSSSAVAVARELGTSRRQIRNALDEAREYFRNAGFED